MQYSSICPALKKDDPRRKILYLTPQDEAMLDAYRNMTPEERDELIETARAIVRRKEATVNQTK
jgi:hypothetical protein